MSVGSKKCTRNSVGCSLCLRVHNNVPAMLFGCFSSLWVQKNIPATMSVTLCVRGFKKYTRNNVGCSLCLRVQRNVPVMVLVAFRVCGFKKNIPATILVALCVCRFKKMYPQRCSLLLVSAGSKKYTRDVSEVTAVFTGSKKMHPRCQ